MRWLQLKQEEVRDILNIIISEPLDSTIVECTMCLHKLIIMMIIKKREKFTVKKSQNTFPHISSLCATRVIRITAANIDVLMVIEFMLSSSALGSILCSEQTATWLAGSSSTAYIKLWRLHVYKAFTRSQWYLQWDAVRWLIRIGVVWMLCVLLM